MTGRLKPVSITVETHIDLDTAQSLYEFYLEEFGELATKAVARQVLHKHEFMDAMDDERVHKYLARDQQGQVVAMCTLTSHLETVPWVSPAYFTHRYPEHAARGAVYYLGFVLVRRQCRRSRLFRQLIERVVEVLVSERAVCSYDICGLNDDHMLGGNIEALLHGISDVEVAPVDAQTYYTAMFTGDPHPTETPTRSGSPAKCPVP